MSETSTASANAFTAVTGDVIPTLRYRDAAAAISWLGKAFGLSEHSVHEGPGGRVEHAELRWGNGLVMLGSEPAGSDDERMAMDLGAASIYLITDDPDTLHDRAVTAGAEIVRELRDEDYGSRGFSARDPEGHYWHFGTYRPAPDGLTKRRRATTVDPVFFPSPEELREWFERHHADEPQLLVGYWKRATGKPSITWPESVDQALCFGWIDGIRRRIDDDSYSIRFTPRRPRSIWSAVNVARMRGLIELGLATPPGLAAFEARREEQTAIYSYEQSGGEGLDEDRRRRFEHADEAWAWFSAQPPGYRRTAAHWVMSAKREETRERRFAALVADSAAGRRIGPLRRQG